MSIEQIFVNMDWELLRKQKEMLLGLLDSDHAEEVEGLLGLIDSIQDCAVDELCLDEAVVFGVSTTN